MVLQVQVDSEREGPLGRTGPRRTRLRALSRSPTNACNLRGCRRAHHSENERAVEQGDYGSGSSPPIKL
jgi:hypothetical protein